MSARWQRFWLLGAWLCLVPLAVRAAGNAPAAPAGAVEVPAYQRVRLHNGMTLLLLPRHDLPLIAFTAIVRGGARLDSPEHAGLAAVTADLLTHGAGARDAFAFADTVEGAGGSLEAEARTEAISVHGGFLARDRALVVGLLADVLRRARLEPAEFEKLRARRIELIKAAKESEPQALLASYGRALLFAHHPFAIPVGGSERSLAALSAADVQGFYRTEFGPDRTTLVIAGDFEPAWMQHALKRAFASWPRARAALPPLAARPSVHGRRVLIVDAPGSAQTYFWLGNVGVARSYPDRAALDLANTAFGGRFGSMLNTELRIKTGLTYGASARFTRNTVPGEFAISSFTKTEDTAQAVQLALATLERLHGAGLSTEQIDAARSYVLGQYPLSFQTDHDWATVLADLSLYGLPDSYINGYEASLRQVDAASVARVIAAAYPSATDLDIVLIGDAAKIRDKVADLGELREMPLTAPDFSPARPAP